MKTYAAYYDDKVRGESSSGGFFSLLAGQFDVIYGAAMTEDCYGTEIIRVEDHDIAPLRGSKYMQAKVGDSFQNAKKDLEEGKRVLFSGTGCQINGLCCFLEKKYDNLFCVDVICHGTPSPKLWRAYAAYQESKYGKLKRVNFRCKDRGEGGLFISKDEDPFMRMFLRDYCLRPACYKCHAKKNRQSDLTMGDFWGIEEVAPEMNDGEGTSLVITRTEKGQKVFDELKKELKWKEVSYEEGVRNNPSEYSSTKRPAVRNQFFEEMLRFPFEELEKKYAEEMKISFGKRVIRKLMGFVKKCLFGSAEGKERSNADYGILYTFEGQDE